MFKFLKIYYIQIEYNLPKKGKTVIRLGSNSPTRALILKDFGINFIQNGGNFDEDSIKTTNPKSFCYEATKGKFNELYNIITLCN